MTAKVAAQQVPGVYRHRAGDVLVTVLNDGALVLGPEYLIGIDAAGLEAGMRRAGRRPPFPTAINAILLQWPDRTVLVDTGSGTTMGPGAGKLPASLAAAGVAPGEVDAVLMTHLHSDHYGGLLDGSGAPAFPNAELVVPQAEAGHWTSDAAMAAAPEAMRDRFQAVRRAMDGYGSRLRLFAGTQPLPGIDAVALPGHTGYFAGTGEARVLVWGDVIHLQDVQGADPAIGLIFDTDPAEAARTRTGILARAADEGFVVTGMHLSLPGFCRITREGDAYAVRPLPWQVEL